MAVTALNILYGTVFLSRFFLRYPTTVSCMPATRIVCRALALATSKNQSVRLERRPTSQVGTIGGLRDLAVFVRAASIVPARQNYSNQRACRVRFTPNSESGFAHEVMSALGIKSRHVQRKNPCPLWTKKAPWLSNRSIGSRADMLDARCPRRAHRPAIASIVSALDDERADRKVSPNVRSFCQRRSFKSIELATAFPPSVFG